MPLRLCQEKEDCIMSRSFPDDPFLRHNYAPWPMEGEIHDLVVEGEIPRELHGTLYRNGPNPQFAPRGRYHWFDGDGMIHAFTIGDGKAHYRNRWVRTRRFTMEREAGEALFGGLTDMTATDPRGEGIFPMRPTPTLSCMPASSWRCGRPVRHISLIPGRSILLVR